MYYCSLASPRDRHFVSIEFVYCLTHYTYATSWLNGSSFGINLGTSVEKLPHIYYHLKTSGAILPSVAS